MADFQSRMSKYLEKVDDSSEKSGSKGGTPKSAGSPSSGRWSPSLVKCKMCEKTVYPMEQITVDMKPFHKTCFKCEHCNKILSVGTYAALDGKAFCKPHFKQLFALKGNYNEGFGTEQHKNKWNRTSSTDHLDAKGEHIGEAAAATKIDEQGAESGPEAEHDSSAQSPTISPTSQQAEMAHGSPTRSEVSLTADVASPTKAESPTAAALPANAEAATLAASPTKSCSTSATSPVTATSTTSPRDTGTPVTAYSPTEAISPNASEVADAASLNKSASPTGSTHLEGHVSPNEATSPGQNPLPESPLPNLKADEHMEETDERAPQEGEQKE